MGFPVVYTEVLLPKLFVHLFIFLDFLRTLILSLLRCLGFADHLLNEPERPTPTRLRDRPPVSAVFFREIVPVFKFEELALAATTTTTTAPESCAVCLYEFQRTEDVRWLSNCRHVFHMGCLDRWMEQDRDTCPLCRTPFVPDELQDEFNRRLWSASGIPDFYGDSTSVVPEL